MNRTRLLTAGAIGALLVVAGTSFASPWWTLHRLQAAAARHDGDAVAAQVDFPALRASVKEQVVASMGGAAAQTDGANPFAAFGTAMAMALVNPLVDAIVSPTGVAAMVEHGRISIAKPARAPEPDDAGDVRDQPRYALAYRGLNSFAVDARDGGSFIFRRDGLWSWKLAGIDLPAGRR
jgi:hypothetical protein